MANIPEMFLGPNFAKLEKHVFTTTLGLSAQDYHRGREVERKFYEFHRDFLARLTAAHGNAITVTKLFHGWMETVSFDARDIDGVNGNPTSTVRVRRMVAEFDPENPNNKVPDEVVKVAIKGPDIAKKLDTPGKYKDKLETEAQLNPTIPENGFDQIIQRLRRALTPITQTYEPAKERDLYLVTDSNGTNVTLSVEKISAVSSKCFLEVEADSPKALRRFVSMYGADMGISWKQKGGTPDAPRFGGESSRRLRKDAGF